MAKQENMVSLCEKAGFGVESIIIFGDPVLSITIKNGQLVSSSSVLTSLGS